MLPRSIHAVIEFRLFLCLWMNSIGCVCACGHIFICQRTLGLFLWVDYCEKHSNEHGSTDSTNFSPLDIYPEVGLMDYMVVLFLKKFF